MTHGETIQPATLQDIASVQLQVIKIVKVDSLVYDAPSQEAMPEGAHPFLAK